MKKVLALTIVAMLVFIPLALAGVVDSPDNDDIADVEVIDVEYVDDDDPDDFPPAFEPEDQESPEASSTPRPEASSTPAPDGTPEVEVVIDVDSSDPDDDPPPPPVVEIVETPTEFEEVYEDINTTHEVVITYISIDGTPIGDPVTMTVETGETIDIPTLPIESFNSTPIGFNEIMPNRDTQVTVIYVPEGFDEELLNIGDYNTPLGLGASMMNVGVCVE